MSQFIQGLQRKIQENSHGMLFGLIASIIVLLFRDTQDVQVIFWISLVSVLIGGLITYFWKVPRKWLTHQTVLIITGIIFLISILSNYTNLFSITGTVKSSLWSWISIKLFGKVLGITVLGGFLTTINIFLGLIVLIVGLFMLGMPIAGLISTITANFTLVLIVLGIVLLFALVMKKK